jgi:hypothetical protein
MEFIVSSLRVATITDLSDFDAIGERLSQLLQLEEDRFVKDSISKSRRQERKHGMICILRRKYSKWET